MRVKKIQFRYKFIWKTLLLLIVLVSGCVQKAKLIQVGAIQFGAESSAAIEKIDALRRKEVEVSPLPPDQATEFFAKAIMNSAAPIDSQRLDLLTHPLALANQKSDAKWQAFLVKVRQQYNEFKATFTSLDKGSWFARSTVKETVPILDKLIAQMTAFAATITKAPARFIRERVTIATEAETIRQTKSQTEVTKLKLVELERRLRTINAAEEELTRTTIEQSLKAATLGAKLRGLIIDYDKLSMDDIAEGLSIAFQIAGSIPGLDVAGLKGNSDAIIKMVTDDETLKNAANALLNEINAAR